MFDGPAGCHGGARARETVGDQAELPGDSVSCGASPPEPRIRGTSGRQYRGDLLAQVPDFTDGEF